MSKRKIIVLIFMIFTIMLVIGICVYKSQSKEIDNTEIAEIEDENVIAEFEDEKNIIEFEEQVDNQISNEQNIEIQTEKNEKDAKKSDEVKKDNSKKVVSQAKEKEQPREQVQEIPQVVETPIVQEQPKQIQEQPKVIEQKHEEPKQESKIYCVDGGSIHIYGDGPNEHGYYNTWDEAFKAYENYTQGWESTQFMVDQCACGLYYFWVTK